MRTVSPLSDCDASSSSDIGAAISSHTLMMPAPRIAGVEILPIIFLRHPLDRLKSADIPSGPVNPLGGLPADEHLAAVEMFPQTDHPTEGSIRIVRPPVRFGGADCTLRRPAPRLGEHSREILREAGVGDDKIADLLARKVAVDAGRL